MSTASRRDGKAALLHTESPLSVTVTLTEADLRAAGVNGSGQRLSLPQVLSWVSLPGGGVAAAEQRIFMSKFVVMVVAPSQTGILTCYCQ